MQTLQPPKQQSKLLCLKVIKIPPGAKIRLQGKEVACTNLETTPASHPPQTNYPPKVSPSRGFM